MFINEVQEVIDKLAVFDKMYEVIRFVDPIAKKVVSYSNNKISELDIKCFEYWGKNSICENCISIRAFNEDKTFVKLEYTSERVFLVTAIPYKLEDKTIVIELLKDITNSMVLENGMQDTSSEIHAIIDNMNRLALKDTLTGCYNRRYINERLPIDIAAMALSERHMSVIMADIDFFKRVNDTYGHLAGDEVIKSFASIITKCLKRESDWVSRFGGEEFLICLPGADIVKAVELAKMMRLETEAAEIIFNNKAIKITASFGVCTIKPAQGSKADSLIDCADKKLYSAKEKGRNRVEY